MPSAGDNSVPSASVADSCSASSEPCSVTPVASKNAAMIAGGVESMSRAPFVMPKADSAFSRSAAVYDTTIGWRFVNPLMKQAHGTDSMGETAENIGKKVDLSRWVTCGFNDIGAHADLAIVEPVVRQEFESLLETYIDNLIERFGGEVE